MSGEWTYFEPVFEHQPVAGAAWAGHRRFGYDLVRNLRPRCVVELGVGLGTSFFALCQAVKDADLPTQLWAVDTWEGDVHTGPLPKTHRQRFEKDLRSLFPALSVRQVASTFDEARRRFAPESIDFLHIDGCHTYESVCHDYETWVDAVRPDGVIAFHDIAVREGTFGVWRLWDEVKQAFASAEFRHSYGLGLLFKTPRWRDLDRLQEEWWQRYRT